VQFRLISENTPKGDQPEAIEQLVDGLNGGEQHQVLLGITGSGKTFTIANVIEQTQRPTLVLAHNKTLAAQLYQEFKTFFPENAVEYFVSYYDYYQPEAYVPAADLYIEKEATVNEEIDRLRLSATRALFERRDVIVDRLNAIPGIHCLKPEGAFYVFPNIAGLIGKSANGKKLNSPCDLADYLLEEAKVAGVPGEDFGSQQHIRFSYATSLEDIEKGCTRIRDAVAKLS